MEKEILLQSNGEKVTFLKCPSAGDKILELLILFPRHDAGPPSHRHIRQQKYLRIISGMMRVEMNGKIYLLQAGDKLEIPVNTKHRYFSHDGKEVIFTATYIPALNFEYVVREMFASGNRAGRKRASIFDAAYILYQVSDELGFYNYPLWLTRCVFFSVYKLGGWLGKIKAKPLYRVTDI
jgi:mannose-6-phosphate isomerase-like protein (cupin superfamily)